MSAQWVGLVFGVLLLVAAARFVAALAARRAPGHWCGIRLRGVEAAPNAWRAGHSAAKPYLWLGLVLAVVDAFAIVMTAAQMGIRHVAAMGIICLIISGALWRVASSAAHKRAAAVVAANQPSAQKPADEG